MGEYLSLSLRRCKHQDQRSTGVKADMGIKYEKERQDCLHCMIYDRALEGRLHMSSLSPGRKRFLDVGSGTGIWAISMANQYPADEHVAIDIGNDHPSEPGVNYDVDFRSAVDFTTNDWGLEPGSFHFVHLGMLCGSVPDWLAMYRKVHQ